MLRVRVAEMNRNLVKQLGVRTFLTQNGKQVGAGAETAGNTSGVSSGGIGRAKSQLPIPGHLSQLGRFLAGAEPAAVRRLAGHRQCPGRRRRIQHIVRQ